MLIKAIAATGRVGPYIIMTSKNAKKPQGILGFSNVIWGFKGIVSFAHIAIWREPIGYIVTYTTLLGTLMRINKSSVPPFIAETSTMTFSLLYVGCYFCFLNMQYKED